MKIFCILWYLFIFSRARKEEINQFEIYNSIWNNSYFICWSQPSTINIFILPTSILSLIKLCIYHQHDQKSMTYKLDTHFNIFYFCFILCHLWMVCHMTYLCCIFHGETVAEDCCLVASIIKRIYHYLWFVNNCVYMLWRKKDDLYN